MSIRINGKTVAGAGKDGVTFTPSITDKKLTWSNDGGLENPPETNLTSAEVYTATIGTTWTEDSETGVKSQTVAITGITAAKTAQVDVIYTGDGTSDSYATFVEQQNQFLDYITNGYAETVEGGITFYIFGDPNTVEIPFIVEVV